MVLVFQLSYKFAFRNDLLEKDWVEMNLAQLCDSDQILPSHNAVNLPDTSQVTVVI